MRTSDRSLLQSLGFADPDKGNPEHDIACRFLAQPEQALKLRAAIDKREDGDMEGFQTWFPSVEWDLNWQTSHAYIYNASEASFTSTGTTERMLFKDEKSTFLVGFVDLVLEYVIHREQDVQMFRRRTDEEVELVRRERFGGDEPKRPVPLILTREMTPRESAQMGAFEAQRKEWEKLGRLIQHEWIEHGEPKRKLLSRPLYKIGIEVKVRRTPVSECLKQLKVYREYAKDVTPSMWVLATRYTLTSSERDLLRTEGFHHIRLAEGFERFLEAERNAAPADDVAF